MGVLSTKLAVLRTAFISLLVVLALGSIAFAQNFSFSAVEIEGNRRVEAGTILTFAGISRGQTVTAGDLNGATQSLLASGLFETVELEPRGSTLVIKVQEFPTINRINIEGNQRIKDEPLVALLSSKPRRVYSPTIAEQDAELITQAYASQGRLAATVTPSIIRRSDNRVDLVFEVTEGRVVEVERVSFAGNRDFSDRRLRRVLETKQAGIFRQFIATDTFIEDRVEFDKQVLTDFYRSRGYVDFEVQGVTSELTRNRDGFLLTFSLREGQQFRFGDVSVESLLDDVDDAEFQDAIKGRDGIIYSPTLVESNIARLERRALQLGLNFVRVEPRVTRNDRELTLDIAYELSRGPRVFVERIDIEGNNTTLDRVIRREFRIVEGDPFNPREIRQSAERIRALGFFGQADVSAREGSSPEQVVIDVDVEEAPTGSLSFGASYGTTSGVGFAVQFRERNFLGRGQEVAVGFNTADGSESLSFQFTEPSLLSRDLTFGLSANYGTTDSEFAAYNTEVASISPSLSFPVSENGRLALRYTYGFDEVKDVASRDNDASNLLSPALLAEEALGRQTYSTLGYTYSYDTRTTGLNPDAGVLFRFAQDFSAGGDKEYIRSSFFLGAETKVLNNDVTLRAIFEGGVLNSLGDQNSSIVDRFSVNNKMRGFEPNGIGPRDGTGTNEGATLGNYFALARFEADFPLGLPEELGIMGGVYFDIGSVWGLDDTAGANGVIDDSLIWRSAVGVSLFWDTAIGPLRFNFSRPIDFEEFDKKQTFDLTVSTSF